MTVASHGAAHVPWTGLSHEELAGQVSRSLALLSDILSSPVTEVAVPFGAYHRDTLRVLRECSVSRVHTSDRGAARPAAWIVPRNTIRADMDLAHIESIVENRFPVKQQIKAMLRELALAQFRS